MKNSEIGSFIAGIGATEDIDSSGEIIEIKGIDHSSLLRDGKVHFEHKNENSSQVIGKIVDCKKILKESDCEHELHKYFWEKARKRPYMYVAAVLFDKMGHQGAMDALAQAKFDKHLDTEKTNGMSWWSIEGSRLNKEGNRIKKCIARDWAYTHRPCNKACIAELLTDEQADKLIPAIAKKKVQDSMKKSMNEESDIKKSDNKYLKQLAGPKKAKIGQRSSTRDYTPITTATGEEKEGTQIQPKRTFSSMAEAPEKMKAGDRILHDKKPRAKGGKAFYRDLYKDLENPIRKSVTKKKELKKAKVDEGKPWGEKRKERRARNETGREQKGVHQQIAIGERGESKARPYEAPTSVERQLPGTNASYKKRSLDAHNKVIQEQKEMSNPNLPKSERNEILKSLANEAWDNFKHKELLIETIKKTKPELSEAEITGIAKTFAYIDMKKKESEIEDIFEKSKGRCWEGYEPTPGKKPYSKGSCRPIKKARVDEGKSPEEKAKARSERHHRQIEIFDTGEKKNKKKAKKYKQKDIWNQDESKPGSPEYPRKGVIRNSKYRHLDQKGVHTSTNLERDDGESSMGHYQRGLKQKDSQKYRNPFWDDAGHKEAAKHSQKRVAEEAKKIKPNLPKSEEMSKADMAKENMDVQEGIYNPIFDHPSKDPKRKVSGLRNFDPKDSGQRKRLKEIHEKKMKEIKQTKPNLPKSEDMDKKEKPFHNYNPSKHSKEGGLNDKERKRINREEGSNLKRPVTGEVKAGSKAAKRRKSFCARMSGNKGPTSKDGKLTPKGAALKRWKCNKNEE